MQVATIRDAHTELEERLFVISVANIVDILWHVAEHS